MMTMNRLDVIRMVGDVITDIDVLRGSLLPNDPVREDLNDYRLLLDGRQQRLTREVFNDNTPAFAAAAAKMSTINSQIEDSLGKLDDLEVTLKKIGAFINAVTNLLSTVAVVA